MAKVDDNVFPKVVLGVGTAPAAPTDSSWKLYSQANGLYAKSSNTTVGPLGTGGGSGIATDTFWDAAGDLAVGTGADTAARLAKGNAGGVLAMGNGAVIWNAGTAFPASKATNDRYWRTDLGMEFYWDGTRWVSSQLFTWTYASGAYGTAPISATGGRLLGPTRGAATNIWLVDAVFGYYMPTGTHNGSNYWTASLQDNNAAVNVTGSVINSDKSSVGVSNNSAPSAIGSAFPTYAVSFALLQLTKTGSPGAIDVTYTVRYRLIET